jgi:hypothetical protein
MQNKISSNNRFFRVFISPVHSGKMSLAMIRNFLGGNKVYISLLQPAAAYLLSFAGGL